MNLVECLKAPLAPLLRRPSNGSFIPHKGLNVDRGRGSLT